LVHKLMKSIGCTIWILGALLVIATLDTLPDPPALDPHTVKASCSRESSGDDTAQQFFCEPPSAGNALPAQWAEWADTQEPHHTAGESTLVRHAADSSPPLFPISTPKFRS
jgi:hypothetical protein